MEQEPEIFIGRNITFSMAKKVMKMLGWRCSNIREVSVNGQDSAYFIICEKTSKDFKYMISGNIDTGIISISKKKL